MIYLILTLFILYTIACCMDGPDLKPIWKTWLGKKLHNKAIYFWPELKYMYNLTLEPPKVEYYKIDYEPIKIRCHNRISEMDLLYQKMYGISLEDSKEYCIKRAAERCVNSVISNLKHSDLIEIQVREDQFNASIDVMAELKVLKNTL